MPTYEYKCAGCGHRFEEFMAISDDRGLIEVAMSKAEADARIAAL